MYAHDIIKINYSQAGYLPYYPYHLISDEEMFKGFLAYDETEETVTSFRKAGNTVTCVLKSMPVECVIELTVTQNDKVIDPATYAFSQLANTITFYDPSLIDTTQSANIKYTYLSTECYMSMNYPYIDDAFYVKYRALLIAMKYHIDLYLAMENADQTTTELYYTDGYENITEADYKTLSKDDRVDWHIGYRIPNWVYSYMLGAVTGPNSDDYDIHDLFVLIDEDNPYNEFIVDSCNLIYEISSDWLSKVQTEDSEHRPPTIFGEPHVWKSLRLQQENPVAG